MPWAAGIFTRVRNWVTDKNGAINPQAALFDQEDDNFASGLNNCVTKDGLNQPSATMNFNAQRLSNLGTQTTSGDATAYLIGTFTGTLTGIAGSPTGTINYMKLGNMVVLWCVAGITGTGNATSFTMTGLPAILQAAASLAYSLPMWVTDAGVPRLATAQIQVGTVLFEAWTALNALGTTGFTASGTKGIPAGWAMVYVPF